MCLFFNFSILPLFFLLLLFAFLVLYICCTTPRSTHFVWVHSINESQVLMLCMWYYCTCASAWFSKNCNVPKDCTAFSWVHCYLVVFCITTSYLEVVMMHQVAIIIAWFPSFVLRVINSKEKSGRNEKTENESLTATNLLTSNEY